MSTRITASELALTLSRPALFGECVDLRGVHIDGDLALSERDLAGFDLTEAQFHGALQLTDLGFAGLSWFRKARFTGRVVFERCWFQNDARFDGAHFDQGAAFLACEFRGVAVFDGAKFNAGADFAGSLFDANLSLSHTHCSDDLNLGQTTIMGGIWAQGLEADLSRIEHQSQIFGRREQP